MLYLILTTKIPLWGFSLIIGYIGNSIGVLSMTHNIDSPDSTLLLSLFC